MGEKVHPPARPGLQFSYGTVESALSSLYGVSDDAQRRIDFRARVNYLQRGNVLGESAKVGTGTRLTYGVDQVERWFACLELAELGISPTVAARFVVECWDLLAPIFRKAQKTVIHDPTDDDVVLLLPLVHLMSGSWAPRTGFPGVPVIVDCTMRELPKKVLQYMQLRHDDPAVVAPRMLVMNLSARLRSLHAVLTSENVDELIAERRAAIEKKSAPKGRKRK
jgi:hypothetical protein